MELKDRTDADGALAEWLRGRTFGSIRVADVDTSRSEDSEGEIALYLRLTVPVDDATWDVADIHDLELAVRDKALSLRVRWPWYVDLRPEVDEAQAEDSQPEPDPVD